MPERPFAEVGNHRCLGHRGGDVPAFGLISDASGYSVGFIWLSSRSHRRDHSLYQE